MVSHAIYSSLSTESATATFLVFSNWKGLNANAYMQMLRKYPEHCTILGTIPQASVLTSDLSQTRFLDSTWWKHSLCVHQFRKRGAPFASAGHLGSRHRVQRNMKESFF